MELKELLTLLGKDVDGCSATVKVANWDAVDKLLSLHEYGINITNLGEIHGWNRDDCKGRKVSLVFTRLTESRRERLFESAADFLSFEVRPKQHRLTHLLTGRQKKLDEAVKEIKEACLDRLTVKELASWEIECWVSVVTTSGYPQIIFHLQHIGDIWPFGDIYLDAWSGKLSAAYQHNIIAEEQYVYPGHVREHLLSLKDRFLKDFLNA